MIRSVLTTTVLLSLTIAGCHYMPWAAGARRPAVPTYEDAGRMFVEAMRAGDLDTAKSLFISREEFESIFSGLDLTAFYDRLWNGFVESIETVQPEMRGARFIRMDMSNAIEPIPVQPGHDFGPVLVTTEVLMLDNVHVMISAAGRSMDLKLDAMVKVGDSWRLLNPVELN